MNEDIFDAAVLFDNGYFLSEKMHDAIAGRGSFPDSIRQELLELEVHALEVAKVSGGKSYRYRSKDFAKSITTLNSLYGIDTPVRTLARLYAALRLWSPTLIREAPHMFKELGEKSQQLHGMG